MRGMKRSAYRFLVLAALFAVAGLAACGGKDLRAPSGMMDSPEHHYRAGMHFLDTKDPIRALEEFERALQLDPSYGPAVSGKGLAMAMTGEKKESLSRISDGRSAAKGPEEELRSLVAQIRANIALAQSGRLADEKLIAVCEDAYEDGRAIVKKHPQAEDPALFFYMAEAYVQALSLDKAEAAFLLVVQARRGMEDRAKERWEFVQKVRRAAPETTVGKKIALVEKLSRADMAALLVEELQFDRFFSRTQAPGAGTSFRSPEAQGAGNQETSISDVALHPLRTDVEIVAKYGVRGLTVFPDGSFKPDQPLAKAEVAMILEEIIVRAANDPSQATRFIGQDSPFSDVRPDHAFFNAAMLCTTRGLLSASGRSGQFGPMDPVAGVDALLAVKKLKSELRVF